MVLCSGTGSLSDWLTLAKYLFSTVQGLIVTPNLPNYGIVVNTTSQNPGITYSKASAAGLLMPAKDLA